MTKLPLLGLCLLTGAFLVPADAVQYPGGQPPAQQPSGSLSDVLRSEDLLLRHYTPKTAPAEILRSQAFGIMGTEVQVQAYPEAQARWVSNMSSFGESIILYDRPDRIQKLVELLDSLDGAYAPIVEEPSVVRDIEFRNISTDRLHDLLHSLHHNSFSIDEQSRVVLRGRESEVDEIARVIERLDKPRPQIMITAYLVRGGSSNGDAPLPKELVENLRKLVPYSAFSLASLSVLRSEVERGRATQLYLTSANQNESGELRLRFGSHDLDAGSLELSECAFTGTRTFFDTSTTIDSGQYVVLGAAGMGPMFVVLNFDWV